MENIIINDSNFLNNNEIQKIGNKVRAILLSNNKILVFIMVELFITLVVLLIKVKQQMMLLLEN